MNSTTQSLPSLFQNDVVWDSKPCTAIADMSEAERVVMVRSASRKLRGESETIKNALNHYQTHHLANAEFSIQEWIDSVAPDADSSNSDDNAAIESHRRRSRQLTQIYLSQTEKIIKDYRRDSGYCCYGMLAISASRGDILTTTSAESGLRLLCRVQARHFETLMLIDRMKLLHENRTEQTEQAFMQEYLLLTQLIDCHLVATLAEFRKTEALLDGKALFTKYEQYVETHLEWSETGLPSLSSAESAARVFREANTRYSEKVWIALGKLEHSKLPVNEVFAF